MNYSMRHVYFLWYVRQRTIGNTVVGAEAEPSYHRSETSHGRERRFRLASSSFRVYDQLI